MIDFGAINDDRVKDRISARVTLTDNGCWNWNGSRNANAYGLMSHNGKSRSTHRVSFEVFNGPIPDGLHVLHTCDNPSCVNPDHLLVGTAKENRADCKSKGRLGVSIGSQNGFAKLTEADVLEIRTSGIEGREYARKFGMHEGSICNIRAGKTWKHVGGIRSRRGQAKGQDSGRSKLTDEDVLAIRASKEPQTRLATKFGVSPANIRMIVSGRSWKHLLVNPGIGG